MCPTSRERVLKAIRHEETDRVPIDLGGTDVSGIAIGPYGKLCGALDIDAEPFRIVDISQQIVIVDDRVADRVGSDAKAVWHFPAEWRNERAYDGTPVKVPARFQPVTQDNGDRVVLDEQGDACLRMPDGGFYYDLCKHPLQHVEEVRDIDRYADVFASMDRPGWYDMPLDELERTVATIRENNQRALVGCFAGHVFQAGQFLRGWSEFLMDLVGKPALAEAIMDRLVQAHIEAFDRYAESAYKHIDIVEVCDDMGMQNSTWVSPQTYRKLIKPYHKRLYEHIKARTGAPILLHSDGSVSSLIPDFIEIGVDILNPVQYTAGNMDLATLKRDFGDDLCFWGGGVDTQ
ncbi:MAG: hypothetical protein K9M82_12355, partial [Deltaproteobacteria bacterium]|nr:hypothetical protein [Deltaproteobacteria bacterium]